MDSLKSAGPLRTMVALTHAESRMSAQEKHRSPYSELKALLMRHCFTPGEQLQIAALAKRLNTSTTPVREALNRLHAEGFLVLHPHRGFFAKALSVREMTELYELGYLLLKSAIAKSADNRAVAGTGALDSLLADLARIAADGESDGDICATQLEQALQKLVSFTKNNVMHTAFRNFHERTHYVRMLYLQEPSRLRQYIDDLGVLAAAMKSRDMAAAVAVLDECWKCKMRVLPDLVKEAMSRHYI